ncbi:hypothetical protein K402DRAFT_159329 [Aulographum hederae CBS 113979]|uniref:Uncharacterized protein n=1 Tax=Aulographum hederae CBS 113979 TaxID=1176131 RepID=A0A6G1GS64_9PEZI|nr:hypothetical protein K402DRAFT_159329 [Aulographum hederae CBS 113979]
MSTRREARSGISGIAGWTVAPPRAPKGIPDSHQSIPGLLFLVHKSTSVVGANPLQARPAPHLACNCQSTPRYTKRAALVLVLLNPQTAGFVCLSFLAARRLLDSVLSSLSSPLSSSLTLSLFLFTSLSSPLRLSLPTSCHVAADLQPTCTPLCSYTRSCIARDRLAIVLEKASLCPTTYLTTAIFCNRKTDLLSPRSHQPATDSGVYYDQSCGHHLI